MNQVTLINSTNIPESLDDDQWKDDFVQVMNALAWFAAEEVCRAYADLQEAA